MTELPLIFPCVFDSIQFDCLDKIKNVLTNDIIVLNDISVCNRKLLQVGLSQSILDLKELITYKNMKGYRWNSYVLRMASLKLIYIIEVLRSESKQDHLELIEELETCNEGMLLILKTSYDMKCDV